VRNLSSICSIFESVEPKNLLKIATNSIVALGVISRMSFFQKGWLEKQLQTVTYRYNFGKMIDEIGGSNEVRRLLYYSLTQAEVNWDAKVGKASILEVAHHGFFAILATGESFGKVIFLTFLTGKSFKIHFSLMVLSLLAEKVQDELLAALIPFPRSQSDWKDFEKIVAGGFLVVRINTIHHQEGNHTLGKIFPGRRVVIL
jgi:hypothetical protein